MVTNHAYTDACKNVVGVNSALPVLQHVHLSEHNAMYLRSMPDTVLRNSRDLLWVACGWQPSCVWSGWVASGGVAGWGAGWGAPLPTTADRCGMA